MKRLRFLTQNVWWKLAAVAIAILLWLAVGHDPELVSFLSVPVQFKQVPSDLVISSAVIEHVYLELRGTSRLLTRFDDSSAAVTLDLSAVSGPGERTFYIDEQSVTLPQGIRLVRAVPSQLRFEFDHRLARQVRVNVRFAGEPQPGYTLERYEVAPETLTVVGPRSRVAAIESAQTDPIDLSAVVATSEFRVNTFIDDPHVRFEGSPRVVVRVIVVKTQ